MSKFKTTTFGGTYEILKFPDHYVNMAVMVDNEGIDPNSDGKKIVPKGTIVGGASKSVILNTDEFVQEKFDPTPTQSSIKTGSGELYELTWTAVAIGTAGDGIKITLTDPDTEESPLTITTSLQNRTIAVSLETDTNDNSKAILTTAEDLVTAISEDAEASQLVTVEATGNTPATVLAAAGEAITAGGSNGTLENAEGILFNDVDVTHGPREGAMLIHGFVNLNKLPYGDANALVPTLIAADTPSKAAFSMIKLIV